MKTKTMNNKSMKTKNIEEGREKEHSRDGHLFSGVRLVVVLLFAGVDVASAAIYYVLPYGNDSNDGLSLDTAWATIQHAADTVTAGDTVKVQAGTYNEQVTISSSGTAGNPIIFQGEGMPTITHTGTGYTDGPVIISGSYITFTGFNIKAYDTDHDSSHVVGVRLVYDSGASNINISDNYIWTESGYGILFQKRTGNDSVISNNEIHTGHRAGILLSSPDYTQENISIINNTIYADENFQHRDWTDASGIWTYYGTARYLNISYNKILAAGYTGIKIGGLNHTIAYNEVGPKGFVHNAIEITQGETELIGNRVYDTDLNWPTQVNAFYSAGVAQEYRKNLILRDNVVENSRGRALSIGADEHHFIVENFKAINFKGRAIQVGGVEEDQYPWPVRITGNGIFYNITLDVYDPDSGYLQYPIDIISLGECTSDDHTDWNAYIPSDVTFIDVSVTGNYTLETWSVSNYVAYSSNHHFEGTVHVINSNKDDVHMRKYPEGTFNGSIIFYYYADVKVVDANGNPIEGTKVSFAANDSTIKPKNTNYTYVPFPDGVTQDIEYTYTGSDGHTPLPSDTSNTVAIADFKKDINGTYYYTWTITAEKDGYSNSTTVDPDPSWYRSDPNTYQNTVTIVLPTTIDTGTLTGTVTDKDTGAPIEGAVVSTNGYSNTTDDSGNYSITLPTGNYTVTASKTGYQSQSKSAEVFENRTTEVNFTLTVATSTTTTTSTSTTTSTTTTTIPGTTTTTIWPCDLPGDYPTCGEVTLEEVVDFINLWAQGQAELGDVVNLINAWAGS